MRWPAVSLVVEARPGWQDERGHAETILPGFGWHEMLGVREIEVLPVKQVTVRWGGQSMIGTGFAERFEVLASDARAVATFEDGSPAAYERAHGKGRALIIGTFLGERNATDPVAGHPLGDLLADWASVGRPRLASSSFVELRRMAAPSGELLLLFNHGQQPARVDYEWALPWPAASARELVTGAPLDARGGPARIAGNVARISGEIPAESVRVYRVDRR